MKNTERFPPGKFIISLVFLLFCGNVFPADAFYVWQRIWDAAALEAVEAEPEDCRFYFLAGEFDKHNGKLRFTRISVPGELWNDDRFTPVYRIFLSSIDDWENLPDFASYIAPDVGKSSSLQIDFDCPESKLSYYPELLKQFRRVLPENGVLSATVLPCHLKHRKEFANLLTECDFFVIQVHGLDIANETLMQRETALKAIHDADSFGKNYRVALPCYAYQLNYRKSDGKLLFVSAEDAPGQNDELEQKTVEAGYADIVDCVNETRKRMDGHCGGVIWFRLPVAGDRLSLNRETVREISAGKIPEKTLKCLWKTSENGAIMLCILNQGIFDRREFVLKLKWEAPASFYDADLLGGFRSGHSILAVEKEYEIRGPLPPSGSSAKVMWFRPKPDWKTPELEFFLK